jgi:S-adenosylmethionine synthetase
MDYLFSSEAVSIGHPDKVCDQISDAILDEYLSQDINAKVAVECLITTGRLILSGEVNSNANVNAISVAKDVLEKIGYKDDFCGFNCYTAEYQNYIHQQSKEIFSSVETGGAGDQGLMFGYATNETEGLLPLAYYLAQQLMIKLQELRLNEVNPVEFLRPDAKSQVTVNYINEKPSFVKKVVLSTQHSEDVNQEDLRRYILNHVIEPVVSPYLNKSENFEYLINPSGSFTIGGPHGDTGLTGRKIIVDTYGGSAPHGGGAFSGKDPSKVDRSAAYMARYIARHVVAANLADKCTIQLSYAIGVKDAQSVYVNLHQTGKLSEKELLHKIYRIFDLTPNGIAEVLNLKNPIYRMTARNGHFTNEKFPWEKINNNILASLTN